MEHTLREQRLKLLTRLLFIFVIIASASEVIHGHLYQFLVDEHFFYGANPQEFFTSGQFLTYHIKSGLVIDVGIFVLSATTCIIGIMNGSKKKIVNICLILLGCIFFLKAVSPFYPLLQLALSKYSYMLKGYRREAAYRSYGMVQQLLVLLPIALCCIANMKHNNERMGTATSEKSGYGGFFIVALIRNICLPFSTLFIFFTLIRDIILSVGQYPLREIAYSHNKMLLVIVLGCVLSIIAVIRMFQKKAAFVPAVISAEYILICYYIHKVLTAFMFARDFYLRQGYFGSGVFTDVAMVIASAAFIVYYAKSKRVSNTFIN